MVAIGFSIGIFVEMFTLPTYGFAFVLIFPCSSIDAGQLCRRIDRIRCSAKLFLSRLLSSTAWSGDGCCQSFADSLLHCIPIWLYHILLMNLKLIVGGIIDRDYSWGHLLFPRQARDSST